jgi:hypothetical protein
MQVLLYIAAFTSTASAVCAVLAFISLKKEINERKS